MADGRRSIACRAEDRAIIGQLWANASSVRKGELTAKTAKKKTAGKPNGAFMKPMTPSPALAEGIGAKPIPADGGDPKALGVRQEERPPGREEQTDDQRRPRR